MFTARSVRRPQGRGRKPSGAAGLWPSRTARHGHPILSEKGPTPPRMFLGAARRKGQICLSRGFPGQGTARERGWEEGEVAGTAAPCSPDMGSGEGARMGGGRGGRNHRSLLPGRETNSSATSDRWKVRGSTLPGRGVGDARTETRSFNIM